MDRHESQRRMVDVFNMSDADKDGALSPVEVSGADAGALRAADRNGDGKLQLKQLVDARAADFDAADPNGDGALTLDEVASIR